MSVISHPISAIRRHPWKALFAIVLAAVGGWILMEFADGTDREEILAYGQRIPAWILVGTFFVLPLVGVPITLFLVLLGIRFGVGWGMFVTTFAVVFHNFAAYRITHGLFRDRVLDWCRRKGHAIPGVPAKHRVWFTAVFAAVHGPPYAMKLYLLALTDVPLRVYLWAGAPVYIGFCILPLGFGHAFTEMNVGLIIALVTIGLGTIVLGRWLKGRMGGKNGV